MYPASTKSCKSDRNPMQSSHGFASVLHVKCIAYVPWIPSQCHAEPAQLRHSCWGSWIVAYYVRLQTCCSPSFHGWLLCKVSKFYKFRRTSPSIFLKNFHFGLTISEISPYNLVFVLDIHSNFCPSWWEHQESRHKLCTLFPFHCQSHKATSMWRVYL